jgi:hypothetical protein
MILVIFILTFVNKNLIAQEQYYFEILCDADVFYLDSLAENSVIPISNLAFYYFCKTKNVNAFKKLFLQAMHDEGRMYALVGLFLFDKKEYVKFKKEIDYTGMIKAISGDLRTGRVNKDFIESVENGNIFLSLFRFINTIHWTIKLPFPGEIEKPLF